MCCVYCMCVGVLFWKDRRLVKPLLLLHTAPQDCSRLPVLLRMAPQGSDKLSEVMARHHWGGRCEVPRLEVLIGPKAIETHREDS